MNMDMILKIFTFALHTTIIQASITCMDTDNKPVDWYIMYKLPIDKTSSNPTINLGLGYFYMDVHNPAWTLGKSAINKQEQPLAYTLQQIYGSKQDSMHVLYNDEFPNKTESEAHGHTKGILASDENSGFWIIHSIPRFPNDTKTGYSYPDSGSHYGQTILCITLPYTQMNNVGKLFLYNRPFIYDGEATENFCKDNPDLASVIKSKKYIHDPVSNTLVLTSSSGQKFQAFAKTSKWNQELYAALIAPYYQSNLTTETWRNGVHAFPPACDGQYKVYNNVQIAIKGSETVYIKETKDHSKWAVTVDKAKFQVVCIGDINREKGQLKRGGGTVCMDIPAVYSAFTSVLENMTKC